MNSPTLVEVWAPAFRWLKTLTVENTQTIAASGQRWCRLCECEVRWANREQHVRDHEADREAWSAVKTPTIAPDSLERRARREAERKEAADRARSAGLDPFRYRLEVRGGRVVKSRRLRRRNGETDARIHELLREGLMPAAIADRLGLSDAYVRRFIR